MRYVSDWERAILLAPLANHQSSNDRSQIIGLRTRVRGRNDTLFAGERVSRAVATRTMSKSIDYGD